MSESDPARLADRRERESEELEQRSEQLKDDVNDVREDWDRKRQDPSVPGAPPERGKDDD